MRGAGAKGTTAGAGKVNNGAHNELVVQATTLAIQHAVWSQYALLKPWCLYCSACMYHQHRTQQGPSVVDCVVPQLCLLRRDCLKFS